MQHNENSNQNNEKATTDGTGCGCVVLIVLVICYFIFFSDACNSTTTILNKNQDNFKLSLKRIDKSYKDINLYAVIDEKNSINEANIIYYELRNLRISALNKTETESLFEWLLMTVKSDSINNSVHGQFYTYLEGENYLTIDFYRHSFTNTAKDTLFLKFSTKDLRVQQFALVDNPKAPCSAGYPKLSIIGRNIVLLYCNDKQKIINAKIPF